MSNIIIAGAGHGGLTAAARLAIAGHNVTVYEKKNDNTLGYDWHDRFTFSLLAEELCMREEEFSADEWEFRGDCTFVSPSKRKHIDIRYTDENRQMIMNRKAILRRLVSHAQNCGVRFVFNTDILGPEISGNTVTGIVTDDGTVQGDLIIDAAGVNSPLRSNLPKYFQIENAPRQGDVFYAYRAYYNKTADIEPELPFEVYLRHNGDKGLSWFYTAGDYVDVLIGRTFPLREDKIRAEIDLFRTEHPWFGDLILHGGVCGVIPVRRPLTLMVANGYAAVGDSAFMTTPMNGMGIDLSILAGRLLADTVIHANTDRYTAGVLWEYNRDYHMLFGGDTAKNEGLKNALLKMPSEGVDFLFEKDVIQSTDLSGAGRNMNIPALIGKFTRGMKQPPYFLKLINGLLKGSNAATIYKAAPYAYELEKILQWNKDIAACDLRDNLG